MLVGRDALPRVRRRTSEECAKAGKVEAEKMRRKRAMPDARERIPTMSTRAKQEVRLVGSISKFGNLESSSSVVVLVFGALGLGCRKETDVLQLIFLLVYSNHRMRGGRLAYFGQSLRFRLVGSIKAY